MGNNADSLRSAVSQQDTDAIRETVRALPSADLAEYVHLDELPPQRILHLLDHLPPAKRAETFGHFSAQTQRRVADELDDGQMVQLLLSMDADERVDLFNLLGPARRESILRGMAGKERDDLRRLAAHAEGTAGAIMTSEYMAVPLGLSVAEALQHVRTHGPNAETIYQIYVLDQRQHLAGTLSLRELILAPPHSTLAEIMTTGVLSARVDARQEEVSRLIAHYDLLSLPITDAAGRMVGIVTYDDAMDVAESEATEDMHKGASVGSIAGGLRHASLSTLYRKRIGWLILLVFANIFSALGIAYFEAIIEAYIVLVFFLPLLIGSGGNAGSQAATLMVRGLATGDIRFRDWGRLLGRELLVATGLGLTMAVAVAGLGGLRGGPEIALVVALSMVVVVIIGSLIGMCLPFLLSRFKLDPATASAPLVTSVVDASGVLVYFGIATAVLGLPV